MKTPSSESHAGCLTSIVQRSVDVLLSSAIASNLDTQRH